MRHAAKSVIWLAGISVVLGALAADPPKSSIPPAPAKPTTPAASDKAAANVPADAQADAVIVDQRTDEVIRAGLKYLAAQQTPNGSWTSPNGEHPVAVTAYTLMAFMAAGNVPNEGEYGKAVESGAQFLVNCVRSDGYITSEGAAAGKKPSNMYDHGIGAIALGEVYGMTQSPKVREKLKQAVALIVKTQNGQGGWRYNPAPADADISVTVLQVVALRVAKNSGLEVPQATIDRAVAYVKACNDKNSGGFSYQPNQSPGPARTAAAIYALQVCGLYDDPMVKGGAAFLLKHNPKNVGEWFTYGSFYAAPAFYMIGGKEWKTWYTGQKELLLEKVTMQRADQPVAYWESLDGNTRGVGRVYATAVYTMILAMPYHYIPLYQR